MAGLGPAIHDLAKSPLCRTDGLHPYEQAKWDSLHRRSTRSGASRLAASRRF